MLEVVKILETRLVFPNMIYGFVDVSKLFGFIIRAELTGVIEVETVVRDGIQFRTTVRSVGKTINPYYKNKTVRISF